jgi:hypothetical protein
MKKEIKKYLVKVFIPLNPVFVKLLFMINLCLLLEVLLVSVFNLV